MLSAGVLNSRSSSLKPGGHDANQANKEVTKDANNHLHSKKSSQHTTGDLTRGRIGQRPEHLKLCLLVFLRIKQVEINRRRVTLHKLCEVLVRFEFLLAFRSYLVSIESSQVAAIFTYLGGQSHSKWRVLLLKSIT